MHEKKAFSVVPKASPRRPNHVTICLLRHSGESLKNGQLKLRRRNLILCPRPTRIQPYQFEPARQDFERVPVVHGVCEIALTEVLATQMGMMWCSKKVSLFELYKLNPLLPHCGVDCKEARALLYLGSSANCYSLQQLTRPA